MKGTKDFLAAMLVIVSGFASASASAGEAQSNSFLKLTHEQRYWWIHGAVTTSAHLIAMRDKPKGDCVAQWFLKNRAEKQKLIEDTIALNASELPTTVVLGLLTRACGDLLPL